ncbi:MAG: hypothetical protein ACR2HJ_05840 [Fimbriimonadales bacterium]
MKSLLQISSGVTSITKMGVRLAVLLSGFSIAACALGQGMLEPVWIHPQDSAEESLISSDATFVFFSGVQSVSGREGQVRDLATGAIMSTNPGIRDISLSADGRYLSALGDGPPAVYRVANGEFVWGPHFGANREIDGVKLSPTGEFVYLRSWDVVKESGSAVSKVRVGAGSEWSIVFPHGVLPSKPTLSPDGSRGAFTFGTNLYFFDTDGNFEFFRSRKVDLPSSRGRTKLPCRGAW